MKMVVRMIATFLSVGLILAILLFCQPHCQLVGEFHAKASLPSLSVSAVNAKQFLWDCKLTSPISEFPVFSKALINTGAAVVLIHDRLVSHLVLPCRSLSRPLPICTATNSCKLLTEYVTLSLSLSDLAYAALPITAIISDTLSSDIILGMSFLQKNHIIVDTHAGRVTDK